MFTKDQIAEIVTSQLAALLWSEGEICDENGEPTLEMWDEQYEAKDATPELVAQLTEELEYLNVYDVDFTADFAHALEVYSRHFGSAWAESFGHDLALTRNGHGAGFWDRGLGEAGDVLTDWADSLGTLNVYPANEGMFHAE